MHIDEAIPSKDPAAEPAGILYALVLHESQEFVEFETGRSKLTIFHALGVSRQISLGYAETALLSSFVLRPGEVISRQELLGLAWPDRVVQEGSLNQAISTLRGVLGDEQRRDIILTIPRRGYQLNANALMEWSTWLSFKSGLMGDPESDENTLHILPQVTPSTATRWHIGSPFLNFTRLSGLLVLLLLLAVMGIRHFRAANPSYYLENFKLDNLELTLISYDQSSFSSARDAVLPIFQKLNLLNTGVVLVNRMHSYYEFNCLRKDGTIYTLIVQESQLYSIDEHELMRCLQ